MVSLVVEDLYFFEKNFLAALLHAGFLWLLTMGLGSSCGAQASLVAELRLYRAGGLSSSSSRALEHRLSSCGSRTQLPLGMWNLPGPRIEPVSHTLAGGLIHL